MNRERMNRESLATSESKSLAQIQTPLRVGDTVRFDYGLYEAQGKIVEDHGNMDFAVAVC